MAVDQHGTPVDFATLTALAPAALVTLVEQLRDLILSLEPQAVVVIRLGDRAATFGVGRKKMSEGCVYIIPHRQWINLGFYKGADLDDPTGLLGGTGAKMRHIKLHDTEEAGNPAISELIAAAFAERRAALGRN